MAELNRRDFVRNAVGAGTTLGLSRPLAAQAAQGRVAGANDRINLGIIGVGGRGSSLLRQFLRIGEADGKSRFAAVCDVYEKRKQEAQERSKAEFATLDYRALL